MHIFIETNYFQVRLTHVLKNLVDLHVGQLTLLLKKEVEFFLFNAVFGQHTSTFLSRTTADFQALFDNQFQSRALRCTSKVEKGCSFFCENEAVAFEAKDAEVLFDFLEAKWVRHWCLKFDVAEVAGASFKSFVTSFADIVLIHRSHARIV